jgi:MerR family transcriptional regulator, copper efflux regulator
MARAPIACSLTAGDAALRGEEWRQFVERRVAQVERDGTVARLRLRDDGDAILEAVDLSRREKACCAFFDFRLELQPGAVWLEVTAPKEAAPILDALFDPT